MIGRTGTTKPDVGWRAFLSCRPPRSSLARSALLSARFGKQPHKTRLNFSGSVKCLNKGLPPLRREYELALVCNCLLSLKASALQNKIGHTDALRICSRSDEFLLRFGRANVKPSRPHGPFGNCLGHPFRSLFVHTLYVKPGLSSMRTHNVQRHDGAIQINQELRAEAVLVDVFDYFDFGDGD